tara:strand:- start:631 stop:1071 length:441 start_codon:yes stop_codon:yes gene_type:complete
MIDKITNDLKIAMKSQNKPKITGLRNILGKLKAKQIDKGDKLNEMESIKILNSAAKQLKDSIQQYSNANRLDLIEKEEYELSLVENYLPEPISEEKIKIEIQKVINETNAKSMADMGKVMGIVMNKFSGSVDGNIVQKIVKDTLNK